MKKTLLLFVYKKGEKRLKKKNEKLHFTTLNYISDYTLQPKIFEYTLYISNYHTYHILYPNITFSDKLDIK